MRINGATLSYTPTHYFSVGHCMFRRTVKMLVREKKKKSSNSMQNRKKLRHSYWITSFAFVFKWFSEFGPEVKHRLCFMFFYVGINIVFQWKFINWESCCAIQQFIQQCINTQQWMYVYTIHAYCDHFRSFSFRNFILDYPDAPIVCLQLCMHCLEQTVALYHAFEKSPTITA